MAQPISMPRVQHVRIVWYDVFVIYLFHKHLMKAASEAKFSMLSCRLWFWISSRWKKGTKHYIMMTLHVRSRMTAQPKAHQQLRLNRYLCSIRSWSRYMVSTLLHEWYSTWVWPWMQVTSWKSRATCDTNLHCSHYKAYWYILTMCPWYIKRMENIMHVSLEKTLLATRKWTVCPQKNTVIWMKALVSSFSNPWVVAIASCLVTSCDTEIMFSDFKIPSVCWM